MPLERPDLQGDERIFLGDSTNRFVKGWCKSLHGAAQVVLCEEGRHLLYTGAVLRHNLGGEWDNVLLLTPRMLVDGLTHRNEEGAFAPYQPEPKVIPLPTFRAMERREERISGKPSDDMYQLGEDDVMDWAVTNYLDILARMYERVERDVKRSAASPLQLEKLKGVMDHVRDSITAQGIPFGMLRTALRESKRSASEFEYEFREVPFFTNYISRMIPEAMSWGIIKFGPDSHHRWDGAHPNGRNSEEFLQPFTWKADKDADVVHGSGGSSLADRQHPRAELYAGGKVKHPETGELFMPYHCPNARPMVAVMAKLFGGMLRGVIEPWIPRKSPAVKAMWDTEDRIRSERDRRKKKQNAQKAQPGATDNRLMEELEAATRGVVMEMTQTIEQSLPEESVAALDQVAPRPEMPSGTPVSTAVELELGEAPPVVPADEPPAIEDIAVPVEEALGQEQVDIVTRMVMSDPDAPADMKAAVSEMAACTTPASEVPLTEDESIEEVIVRPEPQAESPPAEPSESPAIRETRAKLANARRERDTAQRSMDQAITEKLAADQALEAKRTKTREAKCRKADTKWRSRVNRVNDCQEVVDDLKQQLAELLEQAASVEAATTA